MSSQYALFQRILTGLTASIAVFSLSPLPSQAWGSLDVKLGQGEEVQAKSGFFGNKKFKAQDRLGDKVEESQGILGNEHQEVKMLGNGFAYNRGIFGNKSLSGGTMLGDKFETHRMLFGLGPRITKVDLSGTTGLAEQFLGGTPRINGAGAFGAGASGAPIDYQKFSPLHKLRNGTVQPGPGFTSDGRPLQPDASALTGGNSGFAPAPLDVPVSEPPQNVPYNPLTP